MATTTAPVPWQREGHSTVSTYLVSDAAQKVIDFMSEVLQATVVWNIPTEDKKGVMHACMRIGDTAVMVQSACKEHAAVPGWVHVYLEDVDKTYALALEKGATAVQEPKDEYYGDRMGAVKDAGGNTWWIATHKFDFVPDCPNAS